jgi:predicted GIY-YIG superfamily endonuclease
MLYVIESSNNLYKIGISNNPLKRLNQLQVGNGEKLKMVAMLNVQNEKITEKRIHSMLWQNKSIFSRNNEWFKLNNELLNWLLEYLQTC